MGLIDKKSSSNDENTDSFQPGDFDLEVNFCKVDMPFDACTPNNHKDQSRIPESALSQKEVVDRNDKKQKKQ